MIINEQSISDKHRTTPKGQSYLNLPPDKFWIRSHADICATATILIVTMTACLTCCQQPKEVQLIEFLDTIQFEERVNSTAKLNQEPDRSRASQKSLDSHNQTVSEDFETAESKSNKISAEPATGALLNDIEDDVEEDENEEFYKRSPLDEQSSPSDEDKDYLELADIELEIEPERRRKSGRALGIKTKSGNKSGRGQARRGKRPTSRTDKVVAQQQQQSVAELKLVDDEECAFILQRPNSECISYTDINDAIEQAKKRLDFEQPDGIHGEELSEAAINAVGLLAEHTTRLLVNKYKLTWHELTFELEQIEMKQTSMWDHCPKTFKHPPTCTKLSRYRTHSGHCNNLKYGTHWGASNTPFKRNLAADFADGISAPRTGDASGLPPVRLIAIELHPDLEVSSQDHSALFMAWGQLLNHDLAMASNARDGTGHGGLCCKQTADKHTCLPIEIGADDPLYSHHGIRCHEFKRSLAALKHGCALGPRSHINTITSYVDASFVYGSTRSMANALRGPGGRLQMWNYFYHHDLKPLLPPQVDEPDEECVGRKNGRYCFLSGDLRTNQQIQLVALHTVHARQHNRLAGALSELNPHWTHNKVYHEARHINIAIVQHILITEYLPALLGPDLMAKYNLVESPADSYWDHYQPEKDASVSYGFAAAAFRQGHSTVPSQVFRYNNQHKLVATHQLRHLYRQPWQLFEPGAMDEFLLGTLNAPSQMLDPFISSDLSGHLLQMPGERVGLDLIAINIQRGRDQGLPGYNAYREWCNLGRATSFNDLETHMRSQSVQLIASLYDSVDDIDLFTGGISEFPQNGAQVGPTFACIIGRQFESLRSGDRFWFESSSRPQAFTIAQLNSIKEVSLARLICANSDNIVTIQQKALHLPHPVLNSRKFCKKLADVNLALWKETNEDDGQWSS